MIVEVKQKHIDEGQQKKGSCCAISMAIQEKTNEYTVTSNVSCIVRVPVKKNNERTTEEINYNLPDCAKKFVSEFDRDKSLVKPFKFTMRPQDDIQRRKLKKEKQNARKRRTDQ